MEMTDPDEPVAIWGWAPEIFVETGRSSATRHIIGHFLIAPNAALQTHRSTFLADLKANQPKLVIDAVADGFAFWYTWQKPCRADSFPELAKFLAEHYEPRVLTPLKEAGEAPVIYVRKW